MSLNEVAQNDNQHPVGLMELLQNPGTRRQTGALIIDGPEDRQVRLFYVRGELVHASSAACQGLDALVEVLGWPGGDAEFVAGALCDLRTIHVDLPRAIQLALRTLDARARSAKSPPSLPPQSGRKARSAPPAEQAAVKGPRTGRARATRRSPEPALDNELSVQLAEYVVGSGFARYACIMRLGGTVQAEAGMESAVEGVPGLRVALGSLMVGHGRAGLDRVVIEDRLGTIVLVGLSGGRALMVLGDRHPEVGDVLESVSRLAATLARHQQ